MSMMSEIAVKTPPIFRNRFDGIEEEQTILVKVQCVGMRYTQVINVGAGGWQTARNGCGGGQVCGGKMSPEGGATTDGDHVYAYGSEPGLNESGALSPSRGRFYTCASSGIRFTRRK
jgi:hypothetical protein